MLHCNLAKLPPRHLLFLPLSSRRLSHRGPAGGYSAASFSRYYHSPAPALRSRVRFSAYSSSSAAAPEEDEEAADGARGKRTTAASRRRRTSWDRSADEYFSRGDGNPRKVSDYDVENEEVANGDRWRRTATRLDEEVSRRSRTPASGRRSSLWDHSAVGFRNPRSVEATEEEEEEDGDRWKRQVHQIARETSRRSSAAMGSNRRSLWKGDGKPRRVQPMQARVNTRGEELDEEEEENEEVEADHAVDNARWREVRERYGFYAAKQGAAAPPPLPQQWRREERWDRKTWREREPSAPSTVPTMAGQAVYGAGPVLAALAAGRREVHALYVQEGLESLAGAGRRRDRKAKGATVEQVLRSAEHLGVKIIPASKHDLNMVVDNRPHQGLVLDASPLEMVHIWGLDLVPDATVPQPVWVALDEVTDPQNLGAIIRSAYFFGAKGVVLCAKNSAPLTGIVSKASAGSLELIEIFSCKNMMKFLSLSAENGWRVLGGSVSSRAVPLGDVPPGKPTVLVLGSEGTGLRPLVERACNLLVQIPGSIEGFVGGAKSADDGEEGDGEKGSVRMGVKPFRAVESLNVSVAAGVLLYHLTGSGGSAEAGIGLD